MATAKKSIDIVFDDKGGITLHVWGKRPRRGTRDVIFARRYSKPNDAVNALVRWADGADTSELGEHQPDMVAMASLEASFFMCRTVSSGRVGLEAAVSEFEEETRQLAKQRQMARSSGADPAKDTSQTAFFAALKELLRG